GSPHYNQIIDQAVGPSPGPSPPWSSDEAMLRDDAQYALTIVVDHNRDPVRPQAGSCIFLHPWPAPDIASPGCTMLDRRDIARLLAWLDPAASPLLIQLPRAIYQAVAASWGLPPPDPAPGRSGIDDRTRSQ
ncbi:MAG: hypothetical protein ABUR63_05410, partial [Verrucomicrobiota bacterium]